MDRTYPLIQSALTVVAVVSIAASYSLTFKKILTRYGLRTEVMGPLLNIATWAAIGACGMVGLFAPDAAPRWKVLCAVMAVFGPVAVLWEVLEHRSILRFGTGHEMHDSRK